VTLEVDGHYFASLLACECSTHPKLARFVPLDGDLGRCPSCVGSYSAHPLHRHIEVPAIALARQGRRSLASIGAPLAAAVWVRGDRGDVLFCRRAPGAALGADVKEETEEEIVHDSQ
jgi:hypothetical protein